MNTKLLMTAAALCLASTPALAQTQSEDIVVTGHPIIEENAVDAFGSLSTVVTAEQISDLNAIDLSSALRRSPGVVVSRFNPVGSFGGDEGGAIYVRGFGASRPGSEIRTYIDGAPFYMGVWNHPLLDLLPVGGVDSISVYKGPQPQTYGNTFAAIDLATHRPTADGSSGNLRLSAGSFSTFVEQLNASGRSQSFDWSFAQGYAESDGHREDADGQLFNVMGSLGYQLSPHWSLRGTLLYADNEASDPGEEGLPLTKTGQFNTTGRFGVATLAHDYENIDGSLTLYINDGEGAWLNPAAFDTISEFQLYGLRWMEAYTPWSGGLIQGGVDYDVISGNLTSAPFDGETLRLLMPHVAISQDFALGGGWTVTPSAGVRLYEHSDLESETAPHAGLVLASDDLSFRINYSRGVNYPGLDAQVLSFFVGLGDTWRDLEPETLEHYEVGATANIGDATRVDVAVFKDELSNRYVFAFPPTVASPSFINFGAYDVSGLEISIWQQLSPNWSAFAGFTALDSSINTVPYIPETSISVGLSGDIGPWRLRLDAQHQASMLTLNEARADGAINTRSVDSFTVLNARIAYALPSLGDNGEIFLAAENIGDAEYEMRAGYPMPGASAQLGVNFSF